MLVFGLGISMFVAITITMQDISTAVYETSADVEFDILMDKMKDRMLSLFSNMQVWRGEITFDYNLDLPRLLVNKFYYELNMEERNGSYYLVGSTVSSDNQINIEKLLLFSPNEVFIFGSISSIKSNPFISIQKNFSGQITMELGNN